MKITSVTPSPALRTMEWRAPPAPAIEPLAAG